MDQALTLGPDEPVRTQILAAKVGPQASSFPARSHEPKRVCMLSYSDYHLDARVARYAKTLASRGDHVDMLAVRSRPGSPRREIIGNIHLSNLQSRLVKDERSKFSYLFRILCFLALSSLRISWNHARKRYDLLHIHNVPDFLVLSGWLPKLTGCKVILDIHDLLPEFYENKFGSSPGSATVRLLRMGERRCARFADHLIVANHLWWDKYADRTGTGRKCSVFINNVDTGVFRPTSRSRADGKFILLFPGGLQRHQGLDLALRAFQSVSIAVPRAEFHIYGDGSMKEGLKSLASSLGLDGKVRFFEPVPLGRIAEIMAGADLGVVPKRADSFGNEAYSTKIMEFMSVGIPVVVARTRVDGFYFDDSVVRFFEPGDPHALAEAILELINDPEQRRRLVENGLKYAQANCWELRAPDYVHLVDCLVSGVIA